MFFQVCKHLKELASHQTSVNKGMSLDPATVSIMVELEKEPTY